MLRPHPEQTLFGTVPVRLIVASVMLIAVVASAVLALGVRQETALIFFLLTAVGIGVIVTYGQYHAATRSLEQVKGLARNILHSIPTGIVTVSEDGRLTAINPAAEKILGLDATQSLGHHYRELFGETDPFRGLLSEALSHRPFIQEKDFRYPAGAAGPAFLRVTVSELRTHEQGYAGALLLLKDISEQLILEQHLRTSEKLAALHTLSAGVAHEIRNPLSAVDLNLHLLEQEWSARERTDPEVKKYFEILNAEVVRLKQILDNFMRFSRPIALKLEPVPLSRMIGHIVKLLEYEAREKKIAFEPDLPEDLPWVQGDETELSQVFLNIIINAMQAMPGGGRLTISAGVTERVGTPMAEIRFTDTGTGIGPGNLGRVFEPFYTTKDQGSGMGLAVAYRIVEDHGGMIRVDSREGSGATVTVLLPCAEAFKKTEAVSS